MRKGQKSVIAREPELRTEVCPPVKAMPGQVCNYHLERQGVRIQASIVISGTPFCRDCLREKSDRISAGGIMELLTRKPQAQRSDGG
jgi:hypothetical protein